ncbi:MAG: CRISPR-associated endonuclease Cas2 [bacterium]|nr:CRISPR-associated endonuclease Cas2 [bacterium]
MKKTTAYTLTTILLRAIAGGGLLAAILIAPNIAIALKPFLKQEDWKTFHEKERRRIKEAIRRLRERRLTEIIVKNGKEYLQITEQGKKILRNFELDIITLPQKNRWDHKWRIVMFDIPEQKRKSRRVFQTKLVELGFFPLQKSVFAYPHPCHDEIDFVTMFFELGQHVIYCETDDLGEYETRARVYFHLL